MAYEFEQSETLENNSPWCKQPGTYHVIVSAVDENPATRDGSPIDGLKVTAEILDGTEKGEIGKSLDLTFYNPDPSGKDKGEFARLKLTRLFLALGILRDHRPGVRVSVDVADGNGRQMVIRMIKKKDKNFLDLDGAAIFHVDDVEAADIPKDGGALAVIPPELRKSAVAKPQAAALVDC